MHGMGKVLEAPTWPVITEDEAGAVIAQFSDVGRVEAVNWHSPRPFSAAALVRTDRGEFILKRHHPRLRSAQALGEEHAFMAHLHTAGLCVPKVLATFDGATAWQDGGWVYELHSKAPGVDLYRDSLSWTPFSSSTHAFASGEALARLHLAARGFAAPQRGAHPLVSSFTILPSHEPLAAAEQYISARPAIARYLADKPWQNELTRLFATFGDGLAQRLAGYTPLWTHNDWHPSNQLWAADGSTVTAIFDFGLAAPSCALYDIAFAIERCAIAWLDLSEKRTDIPIDVDAAVRLLEGYSSLAPLSGYDITTIIRMLPLVHIEFALSEIDYFAGILNDAEQSAMAWNDYAISHADWFTSPTGRNFLIELERKATV